MQINKTINKRTKEKGEQSMKFNTHDRKNLKGNSSKQTFSSYTLLPIVGTNNKQESK